MSEPYIGEIRMFAGNYAPEGWHLCDGSLLSIAENDVLFALIGTTYGGDGQSTFALPDLRGRVMVHQGQSPATHTTFPLGQKAGTETVTLTLEQLPTHTHVAKAQSNGAEGGTPANAYWSQSKIYADAPNGKMRAGLVAGAFKSGPHDNMMPFVAVTFIIATVGLFPPQS